MKMKKIQKTIKTIQSLIKKRKGPWTPLAKEKNFVRRVALYFPLGGVLRGRIEGKNRWHTSIVGCKNMDCKQCPIGSINYDRKERSCHEIFNQLSSEDVLLLAEMGCDIAEHNDEEVWWE